MSAFDQLNRIAIQYRNQVEECKNFIAWIYLRLNKTEKNEGHIPALSCEPNLRLSVAKLLNELDNDDNSRI